MKMNMYVGDFFLSKPFEEYEKMQLNLVKNLKWLDFSKLEYFPNEAKQIFSLNKLLSEERINKITEEIKKRINYLKNLK